MKLHSIACFFSCLVVALSLGFACGPKPPGNNSDSGTHDSGSQDSGVACATSCASGHCLTDGTCVACLTDSHCGGASSRCEPAGHTCVACLPGTADNCAAGSYCGGDFACHQGCKVGADCSSGTCLGSHECADCKDD